jgi:hypothetical protein
MRKAAAVWTIAILAFMIGWGLAAHGQDSPAAKSDADAKGLAQEKAKADTAAAYERVHQAAWAALHPVHAYRVDFSLNELEDGKKINTRQYAVNVNSNESNEIKIGTKVPVETKDSEFQYMDVGTNVWCRIEERPDGVALSVRAENSNFAIPEQGAGHDARPVIRQLKISGSTLALLDRPMIVGSMDDPNSKRQFQLEVTVTKLR